MRVVTPPLKSQGIKTKLVPWIKELAPAFQGRWIEPFLGTGVVALNSGSKQALLGDINPHIIRLYQAIQSGEITPAITRQFLEKEGAILSQSDEDGYVHFRHVRDRFNTSHEPLDLLFLSRAGFNGMMRFNRKGAWNIPFCKKPGRFAPAYITKIVNQVEDAAKIIHPGWKFVSSDFESILAQAGPDDLIYCDPPYLGRHVDYFSNWTEDDERRLAALLAATPAKFILSTWHHNDYRKNEAIPAYWSQFNVVTRDHFYHTGGKLENRRSVVEALIFNFDAAVPKHSVKPAAPFKQFELFFDPLAEVA
ncbi:MAG: Dam family site-specific DNA-(adenine-N6)-methyltransferase [Verrucomicrobiaceae bacterium]|nr:Dam family site-specific DNA-(adenine-N6)-methyltransferase [Verrucomicrobiaceae bacterium]